tara:strand:+ start:30763 stop:31947 length:1185 start_codon:yes stop_codon:yes gene_type:complete
MEYKINNILIVGCGYVGAAISALYSEKCYVTIIDNDDEKVEKISNGISPINEKHIIEAFAKNIHKITASKKLEEHLDKTKFDLSFICLPTDFEQNSSKLDTSIIDKFIKILVKDGNFPIVIKSTIPIGYTRNQRNAYKTDKILFSPEFLREGSAFQDSIKPSRIILSKNEKYQDSIIKFMKDSTINSPDCYLMESSEAEASKLFANAYLAMRVSFFNELDNFAIQENFSALDIIKGVSSDNRIGFQYNNPSFGYGGYCLPKDTLQLISSLGNGYKLIPSIPKSNESRIDIISNKIMSKLTKKSCVGIYRLISKFQSDNNRNSAIIRIIESLKKSKIKIIIYEPNISSPEFLNCHIEKDLRLFKEKSTIIVTNRNDIKLKDVMNKVFTRDLFNIS